METKTIKITDLMNRNFYSFWLNERPKSILSGGRSSMKSSVISLKLVIDFLDDPQGNVICLRKVAKYLSTSVYEQIKWAIYMLGVEDEFFFGKSPLKIEHKETKTAFYFYGVDDPQKLKSMNIAVGYIMALWFEELAEFSGVEDIDIVEDTFIRQDLGEKEVKIYYSYNPPRNPYAWVNEWRDDKAGDDEYFLHHSTYLEDEKGFLSDQLIRKIERYKEQDEDYWRWMYSGEVIGLGDMVYNMNHFHEIDQLPEDDALILIDIAIDTGHQVSATTYLAFGLTKKQNVILLDTYYYSPENKVVKKAPSELSTELKEWMDKISQEYNKYFDKQTIDSAEGALRNQFFKDYGIRLHPVAKKKKIDMIDNVQDLLAQGRFFVLKTESNQIFLTEHRKYQWDADTLQSDDPKIIKIDDHTCDAFQYYVNDNLQKLGLKN
ncbi:PBSX family phage terminase large subunit [Bacillus subtilis]|uniref:PBSX family phage terminase large subunit n=1 Tax=Bacillus subtilis TaxID=1423 RepID=UPI0011160A9F|nr:PBSX family phage terminase large subunit [Bacillus subtilis]MDI6567112.1 PBSX family phage terminase large subunit [Bacillus subtilis]MEC3621551.1 PBSX family phage terminase large subunit [Bacillus subtilis]MEC3633398.1 PBSX family phage terminase large subunit [Bacillus subtilis]MEC3643856.1 PBSX family phage terminase large subunit [Bacillus subtilis]MEC3648851.1 PBSX family phage terminase large subunit [Bacillus subtilis]